MKYKKEVHAQFGRTSSWTHAAGGLGPDDWVPLEAVEWFLPHVEGKINVYWLRELAHPKLSGEGGSVETVQSI